MSHDQNLLGSFLRERRARLDPAHFGLPLGRRRTPGLRREEVAQIANVSATWYTWLEQGRGGAPSADVLDRLSRALALSHDEREHMFLLAQERPPRIERSEDQTITPQMQRVLDALSDSPALIKTPEWNVLAWNSAASAVLADYGKVPPAQRNVLRMMFGGDRPQHLPNWQEVARLMVATTRRDITRAGMRPETHALIEDLLEQSDDFRALWLEQDVQTHGEGEKLIVHPLAGLIRLDYSSFAVDSRPDLVMVVFTPSTEGDRDAVRALLQSSKQAR